MQKEDQLNSFLHPLSFDKFQAADQIKLIVVPFVKQFWTKT